MLSQVYNATVVKINLKKN